MMMQLNGYKGNDMSLGGSSESSQQLDPALRDAFLSNVTSAQNVAGGLKARQFADFNADQNAAFQQFRNLADPNSEALQGLRNAYATVQQGALYNPQNVASRDAASQGYNAALAQSTGYGTRDFAGVSAGAAERARAAQLARGDIRDVGTTGVSGAQVASEALGQIAPQARQNVRDVQAQSFLNQNIQQYMNPYTQAVTEQSLADLERSRQLQQQQTAAQATAAKAFGGSRQGVAEAETNRAFGENAARLVAQQNAAAYQAAQQASEADLGRAMQAQQLNQAQDAATTQQSLQLAGQFGLANQDAALRAALANQGVDVNVGQLNTQNAQQAALANQAAANQMAQFNAGNFQQAGLANQAATNQANQFTAAALNQMYGQNAAAQNQASQFSASAANQANLANAQNFLQANLANQQAGLAANQQRIGAGNQLANIAQTGQNMQFTGAENLARSGTAQQQFSQATLDAIRNLPLEQQQIINQALGINVGGGSGMQSTMQNNQGLLGIFG
jgi:hypothetical protein